MTNSTERSIVYPMKHQFYEEHFKQQADGKMACFALPNNHKPFVFESTFRDMSLAPGGLMGQEMYKAEYVTHEWDKESS